MRPMQVGSGKRSGPSSNDEGSLDQYLREISRYPLINQEEEVRLAKLIRKADEEALDKLVRSNLRFVVSVAKKYQNQGVALGDLINEGNLGLIRAAHKFDETKGIKFISYAVWWIRQAILQALAEQSRIVRVPLNRAGALHRIGKRTSALLQELGREPTVEEIAGDLDLSEEEVQRTLAISQTHLSLDAPLTPGEVYECDVEIVPSCIVVPAGWRIALTVRGKDYEYEGELSEFAKRFHYATRGTGGMTHDDPDNRPKDVFGGTVTLHAGGGRDAYLLLPIIPNAGGA